MEVVHRHVEEEHLPIGRRPDFGNPSGDAFSDETSSDEMVHENSTSPKSVYFDKNDGIWKCHHCTRTHKIGHSWTHHFHHEFSQGSRDTKIQWSVSGEKVRPENEVDISKLVTAVINRQSIIGGDHFKDEILSVSSVKTEEEKTSVRVEANESVRMDVVGEESDDEVIELEFERAVERVHTHTPFCPNCRNQITKVVLRRKKRSSPRPERPLDLFGCFRCLSIFIPSGDCLNPFSFFGSKPNLESPNLEDVRPSTDAGGTTPTAAGKSSLNPLNCFGYKPKPETLKIQGKRPSTDETGSSKTGKAEGTPERREEGVKKEERSREVEGETISHHPTHHHTIHIDDKKTGIINAGVAEEEQPLINGDQRSQSVEILKCIVHGGLLESIASLSVVSSAAASDATTTNVVTIGLATLFSGLIAFFYSLVDLRNDVASHDKYEEALGRKGHFFLHSTFAIFSYLLFGLVAPTTYGFAFRDSDDREYKIIAVAAAGFASVLILALVKAYVRGADTFGSYVKTILYYATMVVSASGVAYAAGDFIGVLLEKFGWFDSVEGLIPPASGWAALY